MKPKRSTLNYLRTRTPERLLTAEEEKASAHLYGMFPMMVDVLAPCKRGNVSILHNTPCPKRAYVEGLIRNELRTAEPMVCLEVDGVGWMFDTLHEKWMNRTAVVHAFGDVLLGGLGIGLILWPILRKRNVRSVTVIENNSDVIAIVEPTLRRAQGYEKLRIVEADAREFEAPPARFDYIWLDCVPGYGYGTKMMEVHESWMSRFAPFHRPPKRPGFFLDHWGYQENLLFLLHGEDVEDWPECDRRPYPIGPGDPVVRGMAEGMKVDLFGFEDPDPERQARNLALMKPLGIAIG